MLRSPMAPRSSPPAVRGEDVILGGDARMAGEATTDSARLVGLKGVRRRVVVEGVVRPSLRVRVLFLFFSMKNTSCNVSGTFTSKGASVFFFGFHSILAILEPSGKGLPFPGTPAR